MRRRRHVIGLSVILACGLAAGWWWVRRPAAAAAARVSLAQAAFERVVPVARFKDAPLERVLRECEQLAGVPIVVDWDALRQAGVSRDMRVTLFRYDDTLGEVFERILTQFPEPESEYWCSFEEDDDRITLGVRDPARIRTVLRAYDVADLLEHGSWLDHVTPAPNFGTPGGGGSTVFVEPEFEDDPVVRRRDTLVELLTETVDPDTWTVNGGSVGEIGALGDCLVVVQTAANHRRSENLLADLRRGEVLDADWPGPWEDDLARAALLGRRAAGDVRLDGVPFADALDRLRETFRANIEEDGQLAIEENFAPARPVTVNLARPTLAEAVRAVGRCVAPRPDGIGVDAVGPNELHLTSADAAAGWSDTETYDLRALIPAGDDREAAFEEFVGRMMNEVAPDSWRDLGGNIGAARQIDRIAIITQTRANHRLIRRWLEARLADPQTRPAAAGAAAPRSAQAADVSGAGGRR